MIMIKNAIPRVVNGSESEKSGKFKKPFASKNDIYISCLRLLGLGQKHILTKFSLHLIKKINFQNYFYYPIWML